MKIKEICEYGKKSKIKAGEGLSEGNVKFFTSSSESNKYVNEEQFNCPGIIMGTGGNATLHYCDEPFSVSTDCIVLFPKTKVSPKYLYYFFKGNFHVLQSGFKGAGLKHTSKKYIDEISLNHIPNNDEQVKIVNILDNVNDIISKKNQQLSEYDQLIKSRFVEMFGDRFTNDMGWDTKKLGEIVSFHNGKAHEQVVDVNGKYILVTSRAIASDFTDFRRTNEMLYPLHRNDIVMVMSDVPNGLALAKCQLIEEDNKYTLNQRICSFDNYSFNAIFLLNLLNRHQHFLSFNNQNSQTNLRKNDILDCKLIVPPAELQNQFSDFVEQIDKLKFVVQQSLDETQKLFDSLMQKYFG